MSTPIAFILLLAAAATTSQNTDPVAGCRAAHATDPAAHIACLEKALDARAEDLGSEQVRAQEQSSDIPARRAAVEIISTTYDASGRGTFRLANGQVWREMEVTPAHLRLEPDRQYKARIEKTRVFGYRMYVDGFRRMIKLERVK
jgi:hypothetical protein